MQYYYALCSVCMKYFCNTFSAMSNVIYKYIFEAATCLCRGNEVFSSYDLYVKSSFNSVKNTSKLH